MLRFDHLIFWVREPADMTARSAAFEAAGFTLTDRADAGRESAAACQRLICFRDGSYIELLTIREAQARRAHRLAAFGEAGDGWVDYSLLTDDLAAWTDRLGRAGLRFAGPKSHEKRLEDGREWGVRLINPGRDAGHPALPFVLENTAGAALRIPPDRTDHANGARGMLGVRLVVGALARAAPQLSVLFGAPVASPALPKGAGAGLRYWLGSTWVEVFEPGPGGGALARLLERRGEGVYSAVFSGPASRRLDLCAAGPFAEAWIEAR